MQPVLICMLHAQAKQKETRLIDENGLFSLISATKAPDQPRDEPMPQAPSRPASAPGAKASGSKAGQASTSAAAARQSTQRELLQLPSRCVRFIVSMQREAVLF